MAKPISRVPWLATRKNGRWYAFWYDETKRRTESKSLATRDPDEAKARFAAFLTNQDAITGQVGSRLTVGQGLRQYWDEHASKGVIDQDRQENIIANLQGFFGDVAFSDVDQTLCRAYTEARRQGLHGGGMNRRKHYGAAADSTIARELGLLGTAANHARKNKRLGPTADPPTPMPVILKPQFVAEETVWLTVGEFQTLLRWAEGDLLDFIMIAYYTGARRRSIEVLTPGQINLIQGTINLRHPDETILQRRSKKRRPHVPIADELRPTIERMLAENGHTGWLFGAKLDFYYPFKQLLASLKLEHKGFPHVLRHSRATHLLHTGKVSTYHVAQLLGDTEETVRRVYAHACVQNLGDAIRVVSGQK